MTDKITCPNCDFKFDVEDALAGQIEAHLKKEFEQKLAEQNKRLNEERGKIAEQQKRLEAQQEAQAQALKDAVDAELKEKLGKEKARIEKQAQESVAEQLKVLQEENAQRKQENKTLKEKELILKRQEMELNEQKENMTLEIEQKMLEKQKEIEAKIRQKERDEFDGQLKALQEENEQRKQENKSLKEKELILKRQEMELLEQKENMALDVEKQMLERQREIEAKAREKERESFAFKEMEYKKKIDDSLKLAEEMKRKAEQGSMQMQGEIQELALESLLAQTYPFDLIDEVGKGVRGADCLQQVHNARQQVCGSIVYESKRTKAFSNEWIDKLKQDQITSKADIAVIVTETMPKDMERFGERDGVWICGFHEVKSLSFVLREMLIKTHSVKQSQENKGDKMELLYSYLTSNEFVQNIQRIVENYDGMLNQLNAEKKAMHKLWASREKQIWVVQENISSLFGSIKGIAGNELETSSVLELPDIDEE